MQMPWHHPPTKFLLQVLILLMLLSLELTAAKIIVDHEYARPIQLSSFTQPTPLPTETPEPIVSPTPEPTSLPPKPPPPPTFNYEGEDVWKALADYRKAHNKYQFAKDDRLCTLANMRLQELIALGTLDKHAGFKTYFADQGNFRAVGFRKVSENLAYGFATAVAVIEWGWDTSTEGHREAQLTEEYSHACTVADQGYAVLELGGDQF
ncbi:MAG: hypothetical protein Q8R11_01065 [bacterium]|nr:hypothetical protein [bacterium]